MTLAYSLSIIVIRFGECGYLVLTDRPFIWDLFSLSILTQLFQSVILSMSAMDLDFIDPEVEAQMDERQMEEEDEIAIQEARGGGRQQ